MLKYAIIGFGGLGKGHFGNQKFVQARVPNIELVAICDKELSSFGTQTVTNLGENNVNLDLSKYRLYTDVLEMFEKEDLDFVITALPTYLHAEIAVMAMNRGVHVFSEKPMALTLEQCEDMLKASKENHVKLMIGQCRRFAPDYAYVKELIGNGKYGKVIKADFYRFSPTPNWSWQQWLCDEARSGGATLDLHVHDVDFINYAFGLPKAVTSFATNFKTGHEAINTVYHYDDVLVTSVGDWGMPGCFTFTAGYKVRFEKATVIMQDGAVTLYPEDGIPMTVELPEMDGKVEELVYFINCIIEDKPISFNAPESSKQSVRIALAEKISANEGRTVAL